MKPEDSIQQRLQVQTRLTELASVLAWFNQFYQPELSRSLLIQCQTILAEAFTNAVRHAHRHMAAETPIEIEVKLLDHQIEICVWDCGPEFDLNKRLASPEQIAPEAEGGRGIQLIARLADCFTYQRTPEQRNCLRVVKAL